MQIVTAKYFQKQKRQGERQRENSNNALLPGWLSKSKAATTTTTTRRTTTTRTRTMATWIRTRHPREAITIKATLATHGTSEKNVLSSCQEVKLQRQPATTIRCHCHNRVPICMAPRRSNGTGRRGLLGFYCFRSPTGVQCNGGVMLNKPKGMQMLCINFKFTFYVIRQWGGKQ